MLTFNIPGMYTSPGSLVPMQVLKGNLVWG